MSARAWSSTLRFAFRQRSHEPAASTLKQRARRRGRPQRPLRAPMTARVIATVNSQERIARRALHTENRNVELSWDYELMVEIETRQLFLPALGCWRGRWLGSKPRIVNSYRGGEDNLRVYVILQLQGIFSFVAGRVATGWPYLRIAHLSIINILVDQYWRGDTISLVCNLILGYNLPTYKQALYGVAETTTVRRLNTSRSWRLAPRKT
eukprot:6182506-Pleurochrysis_carterae.AAC.3